MNNSEKSPRYRVVLPPDREPLGENQIRSPLAPDGDVVFINSVPLYVGSEIEHPGWPVAGLQPVNELARRIAKYYETHRFSGQLPQSPRDDLTGRFYLPAFSEAGWRARGRQPPAVKEIDAAPSWPRYRFDYGRMIDSRAIEAGEEFCYLAWPSPSMIPVNEAASAVAEYFAANKEHPHLPEAPWNVADDSLWLPDLPAVGPRPGNKNSYAAWPPVHAHSTDARRAYDPLINR